MKFYDCSTAPSPRRVRIFLAEKGIELDTVQVDLRNGEHLSEAFRAINPRCTVPVLELDNGSRLSEALAICRYLELEHPEPVLFGDTAQAQARVLMWNAVCEQDGFHAVAESLRNSARGFRNHAVVGAEDHAQIPALVERGRRRALAFLAQLERQLGTSPYVAGETFSLADITALVTVDFAGWIKLAVPETCAAVQRWYAEVAARPSASV